MHAASSQHRRSPPSKLILSSINHIRPLPARIQQILLCSEEPDMPELLAQDEALGSFILQMANTARTKEARVCSSLGEAVTCLGLKQVQALIASTAAAGQVAGQLPGYRLGGEEFGEHLIATANIARWLAQVLSYPAPEEAYAAGLLHDIGKFLLNPFVLDQFHKFVELMWKRKMYLWQVEKKLLGFDHAEAGGLMAAQWNFPKDLLEAVYFHHEPARAPAQPELAAIVHIANDFSPPDLLGLSSLGGRMAHPDAPGILGLDIPALEQMRVALLKAQETGELGFVRPPHLPEFENIL